MMYNIDIREVQEGKFVAAVREYPYSEIVSDDPEHDICQKLTELGLPDDSVQFWRGKTPSLWHSSIHTMGGLRIKGGDSFPYRRIKRRKVDREIFKNPGSGAAVEPDKAKP